MSVWLLFHKLMSNSLSVGNRTASWSGGVFGVLVIVTSGRKAQQWYAYDSTSVCCWPAKEKKMQLKCERKRKTHTHKHINLLLKSFHVISTQASLVFHDTQFEYVISIGNEEKKKTVSYNKQREIERERIIPECVGMFLVAEIHVILDCWMFSSVVHFLIHSLAALEIYYYLNSYKYKHENAIANGYIAHCNGQHKCNENDIYKSSSCKNPANESSWIKEILFPSKSLYKIVKKNNNNARKRK